MKRVLLLLLVVFSQHISAQNKGKYAVMLNDDTIYFEKMNITFSGPWANGIAIHTADGKKTKIKNKAMKGYKNEDSFMVMSDDDFQYSTVFRNSEYYLGFRSSDGGSSTYVIIGLDKKTIEISRNKDTADFILKYFSECEAFNKELAKFKTESQKGMFPSKRFHELIYSYYDLGCK